MFTQSAVLGARFWLPCVDDLVTVPVWEMEYTVEKVNQFSNIFLFLNNNNNNN